MLSGALNKKESQLADPKSQQSARSKASNFFTQADQRDNSVRVELEKERAAQAAKTAKLRQLRLAKEAAEKEAKPELAQAEPKLKESARTATRKRTIRF